MADIAWDELPPPEIAWEKYQEGLPLISQLRINRFSKFHVSGELHVFCDASEKGCAIVTYFGVPYSDETITTFFSCGKSKVAPIKKMTIP